MSTLKQTTYCANLWKEIYIDDKGDVYGCCIKKPHVLGNIYNEKLEDIWNNKTLHFFRKKSLAGQLSCFNRCTLTRNKTEYPHNSPTAPFSSLENLSIRFGQACQLRCIMCSLDHKDKGSLNLKRILPNLDLTHIKLICIQGGEPLFIKAAKDFFDHAYSLGKKVSFLTNGLMINDEWAKKISICSPFVYFSINAATKKTHELINKGSRWEIVLKNIQRVRDAREKYNTNIKIFGHMTIVIENLPEIPLFIEKFKRLGFDKINFGFDSSVPLYLTSHLKEMLHLRIKIRKALENSCDYDKIDLHQLNILGLV